MTPAPDPFDPKNPIFRRDRLHREALVDLILGLADVEQISVRLNIRKKSVYELCRRFDRSTKKKWPYPWRQKKAKIRLSQDADPDHSED